MATYVLVHGAYHGGWCWDRVREPLQKHGTVITPTLLGQGYLDPVASDSVNPQVHAAQVIDLLKSADLSNVVLVGHSYGGMVITQVADVEHARLKAIVYLDAFMPSSGDCVKALLPGPIKTVRAPGSGAEVIPALPAEAFGLHGDDAKWVSQNLSMQPVRTVTEAVSLRSRRPADRVRQKVYVLATGWSGSPEHFQSVFRELAADPEWTTVQVAGSHDLMVDRADDVVSILASLA